MSRSLSTKAMVEKLGRGFFVTQVFREALRVDRDAFKQGTAMKTEAIPLRELPEAEYHATATGFALAHYMGVLQQLVHTPGYLKHYRRTSALAARGTTRASDVKYHIEGFLVRTGMLLDRSFQLCSAVCHTGLPLHAVNERAIMGNRIVVSTGLDGPLKALRKLCTPYARARNQVVHQHGLLDEEIRCVEMLLYASRALPPRQRSGASATYRRRVKSLAEGRARELDTFVREAIKVSGELFELLFPQYRLRQRQLRGSDA